MSQAGRPAAFKRFMVNICAPVYISACVGFLFSIFRDYIIFSFTAVPKNYFMIIYLASAISILPINAISMCGRKESLPNLQLLAGVNIFIFIIFRIVSHDKLSFWHQVFAFLLSIVWLYGSFEANDAFLDGKIIFAKTRESIASCITAFVSIINLPLALVVLAGPLISLVPFKLNALIRSYRDRYTSKKNTTYLLVVAALASIGPILVQWWAFKITPYSGLFLGVSYPVAARLGSYIFQVVSIGGTMAVLINRQYISRYSQKLLIIGVLLLIISVILILSNFQVGVVAAPLSIGMSHLLLVLYAQHLRPE